MIIKISNIQGDGMAYLHLNN